MLYKVDDNDIVLINEGSNGNPLFVYASINKHLVIEQYTYTRDAYK